MIDDMRYFVVAGVALLAILLTLLIVYSRRLCRARSATWDELLGRLIVVDRRGVERIARDLGHVGIQHQWNEPESELNYDEVWDLIGGLRGLEALLHNSRVLVDIAAYLQTWYPEAQAAAEDLRQNALEIEWHVERLQAGEKNHNLEGWFVAYARNSAVTYYLMPRRLLAIYEAGNPRLFHDLERAI